MNKQFDLVIVGAGMVGESIALATAQAKARCVWLLLTLPIIKAHPIWAQILTILAAFRL